MKTLIIFRHGKTEKDASEGDKARALLPRGEQESAVMARYLGTLTPRPDRIITSDAIRARQTARIVAAALDRLAALHTESAIYNADLDTLEHLVRRLSDADACVLLVGHNPGFEELGDSLTTGGTAGRHLPTAGAIVLAFDGAHWKDARPGTGQLLGYYDPATLPAPDAEGGP